MSEQVETRLTPRERLTRGLAYSAVGPVDVTRGLLELGVGLGLQSARSTAAGLRRRYREGRLAREVAAAQETLAQELTAAQDVVANLP
ncbi:cell wall synthesis protein CwsA, partial [Mycobacterium tuberculosis]